jgi:chaperonin GroES
MQSKYEWNPHKDWVSPTIDDCPISPEGPIFLPMGDRILVLKDPVEEKTTSGLYIPTTVVDRKFTGTVLFIGNGKRVKKGETYIQYPLEIKTGNKVMFTHYVGHVIKIEDTEYILMKEDDILGICE